MRHILSDMAVFISGTGEAQRKQGPLPSGSRSPSHSTIPGRRRLRARCGSKSWRDSRRRSCPSSLRLLSSHCPRRSSSSSSSRPLRARARPPGHPGPRPAGRLAAPARTRSAARPPPRTYGEAIASRSSPDTHPPPSSGPGSTRSAPYPGERGRTSSEPGPRTHTASRRQWSATRGPRPQPLPVRVPSRVQPGRATLSPSPWSLPSLPQENGIARGPLVTGPDARPRSSSYHSDWPDPRAPP